jgi:cytochrome c556
MESAMTKTELKQKAQDMLLAAIGTAFYADASSLGISEEERDALMAEMSKQMERIEGLFGYKKNSWLRG